MLISVIHTCCMNKIKWKFLVALKICQWENSILHVILVFVLFCFCAFWNVTVKSITFLEGKCLEKYLFQNKHKQPTSKNTSKIALRFKFILTTKESGVKCTQESLNQPTFSMYSKVNLKLEVKEGIIMIRKHKQREGRNWRV